MVRRSVAAGFCWLALLIWIARKELRVLFPADFWRERFISDRFRSKPPLGTGM